MNTQQRITFVLDLAARGILGTPERPNRGSSARCQFWNAYSGLLDPAKIRGTIGYAYAVAGKRHRKAHPDRPAKMPFLRK